MRRGSVAASCSLFAVLALSACSSDGSGDAGATASLAPLGPAVTAAPNAVGAPFADRAALKAALLGVGDLPVGFTPVPDPEDDLGLPPASESADSDKSSTDPAKCGAVLSPVADQRTGATAAASGWFTGPDFATIDQDAASYGTGADASQAFAAVQDALAGCTEYSGTDADGVQVQYRVGGREQQPAGDASLAFRLVTTSEGVSLVSDVVVVLVGSTVTQLVATGQEPIDAGVLNDLTSTAVTKLAPAPAG
ncbi:MULTISPECIES: sensor domain-containing protein [unclassified Rhodococcus (in: high G+C Gram-positive bacteria)]|uniref:sensor domain-containing protein n=1 Tax=unclassified Rhodococcus (in: high G+C Gram-positive bacteria) TaxID=192944 RepID=UPI001639F913|nr:MULTISPECIES: sensor domain-containing protein [unclassified Rhodococcus (in: high G+C Gram-positive bacteria)]MBC2638533.1 sensor domain-containing protein [Rhodococcus sp. 3A]MBC2896726.1 sensor domain-containing protein [Rhodococcus sp. 4CII]